MRGGKERGGRRTLRGKRAEVTGGRRKGRGRGPPLTCIRQPAAHSLASIGGPVDVRSCAGVGAGGGKNTRRSRARFTRGTPGCTCMERSIPLGCSAALRHREHSCSPSALARLSHASHSPVVDDLAPLRRQDRAVPKLTAPQDEGDAETDGVAREGGRDKVGMTGQRMNPSRVAD